jgi:hypothetical protein
MIALELLAEWSRNHCVAICAVLVPANLLATLQILILGGLGYPSGLIRWMSGVAMIYAALMISHVLSWYVIGVIRVPTFILLGLASLCLSINLWAWRGFPLGAWGRQRLRRVQSSWGRFSGFFAAQ